MTLSINQQKNSQYSNVEHLAKIVGLSLRYGRVLFAMMTACFDAAGQLDQKFMVVAGFVSSADDWIDFDRLWRDRLAQDGLSYFHMHDFAQSIEEFSIGWKEDEGRRQRLLGDIMNIIQSHAYQKFSCSVEIQSLNDNIKPEIIEEYHLKSYVFAARDCAARVREWAKSFSAREVPTLVFEYGDLYQRLLTKRLVIDNFAPPIYKFKKDTVNKDGTEIMGFTPLQAADFFAYEVFLATKREDDSRWGMKQFEFKPGPMGMYFPADLKQLEMMLTSPDLRLAPYRDFSPTGRCIT